MEGHLLELPEELFQHVTNYLGVMELVAIASTCNGLYTDAELWRRAHFVAFGTVLEVGDEEDESIWRTEVQRAGILQHNWLTGSFEDIKLRGHEGGISCLHLDHGHLVSGSADKQLIIWDLNTASIVTKLRGHSEGIICVKMSWPQGVVVSGSLDKSARTWSIKENKEVCSVIHEDAVLCLQYKPEFSRVATGSGDACVRFWDPLDPAKVVTMSGHNSNVISIDFNENVIVSGSKDFSVRVWSWDGERLYHFREHADDVYCLLIANGLFISGSLDCYVKIWDATTGQLISSIKAHKADVLAMDYVHPYLITASLDRSINVWDIDQQLARPSRDKPDFSLMGHTSAAEALALGGWQSRFLISAASDRSIGIWDMKSRSLLRMLPGLDWVLCLGASDENIVLGSASSGVITLLRFGHRPAPQTNSTAFVANRDNVASGKKNKGCIIQ